MFAVLEQFDRFGEDIRVIAIYPTFEKAKSYSQEGDRWIEFGYGEVDFDWDKATEFEYEDEE